jgi:hypothetical protein
MKIQFRQSGGFAGLRRGCELDSAELSDSDSLQLNQLVENAAIDKSVNHRCAAARDVELYDLRIIQGDRQVVLQLDEASLTPELTPLIEFLQSKSGPRALDDDITARSDE